MTKRTKSVHCSCDGAEVCIDSTKDSEKRTATYSLAVNGEDTSGTFSHTNIDDYAKQNDYEIAKGDGGNRAVTMTKLHSGITYVRF